MSFTQKSSYSYDEIIACGHGELFGPGNARLPLPPMLMFDRITNVSTEGGEYGKGIIEAEFDIKPDLWFFECHFESDPVMPGCLGLDALWQLAERRDAQDARRQRRACATTSAQHRMQEEVRGRDEGIS